MITQCFFVFSPLWLDEMQRYITAFTSRPPSLHHLGPLWKSFGGLMISSDSKCLGLLGPVINQCFFVFSPLWLDEMQRYITAFTLRPPSLHHLGPLWKSFGGLMISSDLKWGPVEFRIVWSNDHSMLLRLLSPLAWRNAMLCPPSLHQLGPLWKSFGAMVVWWYHQILYGDQLILGLLGPMITQLQHQFISYPT